MNSGISIIIPAYNEAKVINYTIEALLKAKSYYEMFYSNSDIEIIVVNNNSTDETESICKQYDINVIKEEKQQIAACRNKGANHAKNEILVFLDADTVVELDFLVLVFKNINFPNVIGGSAKLIPDKKTFLYLIIYWIWNTFSYLVPFKGAVLYCRRDSYDAVSGFDENLYALEDVKFSIELRRIGRKINKKFLSNRDLKVITFTRKLSSISLFNIAEMLYKIIINPFTFYKRKKIVDKWFYTNR
jgi:glycosyltransferase involved in cell wall biosynthesis